MIDNKLTNTAKTRRAIDPSTEQYLAEVPVSTQEDVDRAVAAAQAAFPAWRDLSQDDRAAYLLKFVDAIDANQQGFAQLLGKEAGKPPQGVGIELFLLSHQIRETLKHRLTEEKIEESEEVCVRTRCAPTQFPFSMALYLALIDLLLSYSEASCYVTFPLA